MKEIYVIKNLGGEYQATTLDEIQKMTDEGRSLIKVVLETEEPAVKINLYKVVLFSFFGISENAGDELVKDYLNYVSSITGFDMPELEF
jgi:hypothetical protein